MKIASKVFKRKSGKSAGKWIVRLSYFDEVLGRTVQRERSSARRSDALDIRNQEIIKIQSSRGQAKDRLTFSQLADICEELFYKPAEIGPEGKKLSGVRSIASVRSQLKSLRKHFNNRPLRLITAEDVSDYKIARLSPKIREQSPVKLATVNRELQTLRRMLRYAKSRDWISKNIFENRSGIIETSAENARTRILSREEETRLLAACSGINEITYTRVRFGKEEEITVNVTRENPLLRAILLLAIDSGMRKGEILKIRWSDLDFGNGLVNIIGTHTKTERSRIAPLSKRTIDALLELQLFSSGGRPFPITDFKNSFTTAKRNAGIEDLRFHDLRRTAITRWIEAGTPLALAGKFAGHAKPETTMKHYVATDLESVRELGLRLNSHNRRFSSYSTVSGTVN